MKALAAIALVPLLAVLLGAAPPAAGNRTDAGAAPAHRVAKAQPPEAGTARAAKATKPQTPDAGPGAVPKAVLGLDDPGADQAAVQRVPALAAQLQKCAPLALGDCHAKPCRGCLTVLIAPTFDGKLDFTLDRQRPGLDYEKAEQCLRAYAGPRPVVKKGHHLRVPVCL